MTMEVKINLAHDGKKSQFQIMCFTNGLEISTSYHSFSDFQQLQKMLLELTEINISKPFPKSSAFISLKQKLSDAKILKRRDSLQDVSNQSEKHKLIANRFIIRNIILVDARGAEPI
jgi:hypothetical protein